MIRRSQSRSLTMEYVPRSVQQHGPRPSKKLRNRCFGPFNIAGRISANAFKLDLGVCQHRALA
jgi:hypothetical protein